MLGINVLFLVAGYYVFRGRGDLSSPHTIVGLFSMLFFCLKYYWNTFWGVGFILNCDESELSNGSGALAIGLMIALICSNYFNRIFIYKNQKKDALIAGENHFFYLHFKSLKILPIVLSLFPIGVFLTAHFLWRVNAFTDPLAMRQLLQSGGFAYLLAVILVLMVLSAVCFTVALMRSWTTRWYWAYAAVNYMIYAFFSGYAGTIFMFFSGIVFSLSVLKRWRLWWLLIILFPLVVLYAVVHNNVRQFKAYDEGYSIVEYMYRDNALSQVLPELFNRLDYLEMMCKGYKELSYVDRRGVQSLLNFFYQPIPRSIWPSKPTNFSTTMSLLIIPDVVSKVGSTANFNAMNEFVFAFGPRHGIVVFGLVFGLILSFSGLIHGKAGNSFGSLIIYVSIIFPFLWVGFAAGFVNDFALAFLIIGYLAFFVLRFLFLRRRFQ